MGGGYTHQTQGTPQALPALIKKLAQEIAALNRRISNIGIQIDPVAGELIIASGRSLVVNGNTLIEGNLSVPNGSITNAALNAPVYPQIAHAQAANFALTTTATEYVRATISVPVGYSQALVFASISANARNKNTVQDFLGGYVDIFGKNSGLDSVADGSPGYSIGIANCGSALLTSLGSSFWVRGMLYSGAKSWAADSFNAINVDAMVLFLR